MEVSSLARHVAVIADRWHPDAVADEALVTLARGGSQTFRITAPATVLAQSVICSGA